MTSEQIKHMVDRFLSWRLPENFCPDAGVSFKAEFNEHTPWPMKHEPVGTNLLDATQAEAMVRHMVEGLAAGAWRSIDSAPKDGTSVLLLIDGTAQQGSYAGPSDGAIYAGSASVYNWFSEASLQTHHDQAVTHWQPLPHGVP